MKIQSIVLATVFATFVSVTAPTNVLAAGPEAQRETITSESFTWRNPRLVDIRVLGRFVLRNSNVTRVQRLLAM
jgi:hypothetical protein